jgi:hypothetical protein
MPRKFWKQLGGSERFEEDGKPKMGMIKGYRTRERQIPRVREEDKAVFVQEDEEVFRDMLSAALAWEPNERARRMQNCEDESRKLGIHDIYVSSDYGCNG